MVIKLSISSGRVMKSDYLKDRHLVLLASGGSQKKTEVATEYQHA